MPYSARHKDTNKLQEKIVENTSTNSELCALCSSNDKELESLFSEYELEKQYTMIKRFKLKGLILLVLQEADLTRAPFNFKQHKAEQFIKDIQKIKDLHENCIIIVPEPLSEENPEDFMIPKTLCL